MPVSNYKSGPRPSSFFWERMFTEIRKERERERWRVCFHNNEISNVYGFIENASPPIPRMLPSIFKLKRKNTLDNSLHLMQIFV